MQWVLSIKMNYKYHQTAEWAELETVSLGIFKQRIHEHLGGAVIRDVRVSEGLELGPGSSKKCSFKNEFVQWQHFIVKFKKNLQSFKTLLGNRVFQFWSYFQVFKLSTDLRANAKKTYSEV